MSPAKPSKILIVDDEPLNIDLLRETLKSKFRLIIATRGDQALSLAEKKMPDLILLDVMMPGMDGFETCEKLKENPKTKHIPVVFVTALNEVEDKSIGYEMGGSDYITKPFEMSDVLTCIETHLSVAKLARRVKELECVYTDNGTIQKIADLNASISGNAQIVNLFWTSIEPIIKNHAMDHFPKHIQDKISNVGDILVSMITETREITSLLQSMDE